MRAVKTKALRKQAREETKGKPARHYWKNTRGEIRNHSESTRGVYRNLKKGVTPNVEKK